MNRSVSQARLISGLVAAGAVAFIALVLAGVAQDWLGGWLIRCGGRFSRHECADGEIPWGLVFSAGVVALVGLLVACGDITIRRGRGSLQTRLEFRRTTSHAASTPGASSSVGPPRTSPSQPPPAPKPAQSSEVDALAREIGL